MGGPCVHLGTSLERYKTETACPANLGIVRPIAGRLLTPRLDRRNLWFVPVKGSEGRKLLRIRQAQMDTFSSDLRGRFVEFLVKHLASLFPNECEMLGGEGLRDWVEATIDEAVGHEIRIEDDVRRYAEFKARNGWRFPDDESLPEVQRILAVEEEDGTWKMDRIDEEFSRAKSVERSSVR